MSDLKAE